MSRTYALFARRLGVERVVAVGTSGAVADGGLSLEERRMDPGRRLFGVPCSVCVVSASGPTEAERLGEAFDAHITGILGSEAEVRMDLPLKVLRISSSVMWLGEPSP